MRAVVALDAILPGEVLDIGVGQAQMGGAERLFEAQQIEAGRSSRGGTEVLASPCEIFLRPGSAPTSRQRA